MRRGWPGLAVRLGARRHPERVAWGRVERREIRFKLTGHRTGTGRSAENGQSRPRHSLISSLIHPGTPASIGVYHGLLSSHKDLRGPSCTVILNPEKRKVGRST